MTTFLIRRLLAVLPVLLVVSLLVFFMLRLAPGDPAAVIAGNNATSEDIAQIRERMGLDQRGCRPRHPGTRKLAIEHAGDDTTPGGPYMHRIHSAS